MRRIKRLGLASVFLLHLAGTGAQAATFQVNSTSGNPGDLVTVLIHLQGDGQTVAADLALGFINTRLFIESPPGNLPSGGGGRPVAGTDSTP